MKWVDITLLITELSGDESIAIFLSSINQNPNIKKDKRSIGFQDIGGSRAVRY